MSNRLRPAIGFLALVPAVLAGPVGWAQPLVRVGFEFQVNVHTVNSQEEPAIAPDGAGGFVVVWTDNSQDGFGGGIFGRRFDSDAAPQSGEFQINVLTQPIDDFAHVAADGEGDFVVVWSRDGGDGDDWGVFGRRFDTAGTAQGGEFQVNSFTPGFQGSPSVASAADGDFLVAWTSAGQDGYLGGVFARRFASSGAPQGAEFRINVFTTSYEHSPSVGVQSDGDFIVVWHSYDEIADDSDIFVTRLDSNGAMQGAAFQVNGAPSFNQYSAALAMAGDDDFSVAWTSNSQDGQFGGVFARRFDSGGNAQGLEFRVNSYTPGSQEDPAIASDADGDVLVVWRGAVGHDGSTTGVFGRSFASSGTPQGADFQVNTYTQSYQFEQDIAADAAGGFLVVWRSEHDGSPGGIFAQRFGSTLATLDVDGDGQLGALTDGLLVLRFLFDFTGTTLTTGAVGPMCARCNAAAIEPYIEGLGSTLDIDDNGNLGPLTDGLLILRFLFGFTGTTLTNGAVAGNCVTRCDAATILPYLQTLD